MSPDSDVAAYAATRVVFVTRPALYCGACGARAEEQVYGAIRREVWCINAQCSQHGRKLNVFDPILDGVSHA
jgi:hypothetical protein